MPAMTPTIPAAEIDMLLLAALLPPLPPYAPPPLLLPVEVALALLAAPEDVDDDELELEPASARTPPATALGGEPPPAFEAADLYEARESPLALRLGVRLMYLWREGTAGRLGRTEG